MPGFLSFSYWFSLFPPVLLRNAQILLAAIFILLIGVGLLFLYVWRRQTASKARKQALGAIGHTLLWAGITGAFWLLMAVSGVPVIGMRLWLIVGFVFFAWLLSRPVKALRTTIPAEEQGALSRASYEKWLPKPKK
jgi:preprotein translocase subunit YajC